MGTSTVVTSCRWNVHWRQHTTQIHVSNWCVN